MSGPKPAKNHHTVPQFQLRRFGRNNQLCLHHRSGRIETKPVKKTTALDYFYDPQTGPHVDDSIETWLANRVENPAVDAFGPFRSGLTPTGKAREKAATFLAYAMVRGASFRRILSQVNEHAAPMMWALEALDRYRRHHQEFEVPDDELEDLVAALERVAPDEVRHSTRAADMRNMIREAERLTPLLEAADWTIAQSVERMLVISDTPVVALHPLHGVAPGPQLWPDGYDLYLPVTPKALLIISNSPRVGQNPAVLTRALAQIVNQALAITAHDVVMHHPDMPWPTGLTLRHLPPAIPTPSKTVKPNHDGQERTSLTWPALTTQIAQEAVALLGGDPLLDADPADP